jgi:predicted metal-dependent phosphoesterase TrpH
LKATVDLHLHTTMSDGRLSPTDLVRLCAERGLRQVAITDHDSLEGLPEAQAAAADVGIDVIAGVELGADEKGGEVHLLGYFVNADDPELSSTLADFRDGRTSRGRKIVERLAELDVHVSWERVLEISDGGAVGRPHIAQAMVEKGYVQYPKEAFDQYLGRSGPAYVGRERLTPTEGVAALVRNGAVPVMAHPTYYMGGEGPEDVARLTEMLAGLQQVGLAGMEVHYGDYSPRQVDMLAAIACELGLIQCGGSDYHASGNPDETEPGTVGPPPGVVDALQDVKGRLPRQGGV